MDMIPIATEEEVIKLKGFLNTAGKRLIFYHQDSDGVCSAAQMLSFYPDLEPLSRESPRMDEKFVADTLARNPDLMVFVDLAIDQEAEKIKRMAKELPGCRIVVIDHHIPENNLNSERILHLNHMFKKNIYIPTSYQVYWLLDKMGKKPEPCDWISAIGIIGDYGFRECKDFLARVRVRHPDLLYETPLESKLGKGSEIISSAITIKGMKGADMALKTLIKAKVFEDFSGNEDLKRFDKEMKAEIGKIVDEFPKKKEEFPNLNLIFYEIKSKLNITSIISSVLARLYPEDILVVRKRNTSGWKVSVRFQHGGVNVGAAVKKCVEGIGSGGGHEKAAGAFVRDWEEFKDRFIEIVGNLQVHGQDNLEQTDPYIVTKNGDKA